MSDPSPSGETWVCRANPAVYGVCTSPVGAIPGHNGCGPVPSSDTPSDERRPVDGGERSQSEQWFVVHHNQIRSLRFGTFPIERLARASIAACTCGPHTLRHTVTTTYTASTTEEFVAAAADRGDRA